MCFEWMDCDHRSVSGTLIFLLLLYLCSPCKEEAPISGPKPLLQLQSLSRHPGELRPHLTDLSQIFQTQASQQLCGEGGKRAAIVLSQVWFHFGIAQNQVTTTAAVGAFTCFWLHSAQCPVLLPFQLFTTLVRCKDPLPQRSSLGQSCFSVWFGP